MDKPPVLSRLMIVGAATLFSTGGAAIKLCTLSSWQVAGFRSGIAALTVLLALPEARRPWKPRVLLVGAAYAATLVSFVAANKLTTSANAIFLQSTAPLYILLLGPILLREPVTKRDLWFLAALATGLGLFFVETRPVYATAPRPLEGNCVAVLSGVFFALLVTGLRWLARDEAGDDTAGGSTMTAVACGNVIAFAFCLPMAFPIGRSTPRDWLVLVFLGVIQIGLAYVLLAGGMRHVRALSASLLLLVEPVLNPIWSWLVHGERIGVWAGVGASIILAATAARTLGEPARRREP